MLKIIYYVDSASGESSIRENINNIKKDSVRAKVRASIMYAAENDGKAASIITKNIRGYHFSEVRVKFSRDLYRILYFIWRNDKMVLLHMFVKKENQKTPEKELIEAEMRYKNFINNIRLYE
ncbi:MAG TPA: hypothetical protein ENH26_01355 [Candidatus Wolfebacteria bacterium]|nr:hypothetical protein [Candidatus Wolfebacteria bacterium]